MGWLLEDTSLLSYGPCNIASHCRISKPDALIVSGHGCLVTWGHMFFPAANNSGTLSLCIMTK